MIVRRLRTMRAREVRGCTFDADASRLSSLFDADTGGAIVAPDAAVGRWESAGAGAHHATQSNASLRPIYRRRGLNGQPVLETTGASTCHLQTASYYPSAGSAAFTAMTVASPETSLQFSVPWEYGRNSTGARVTPCIRAFDTGSMTDVFGSYYGRTPTAAATAPSVMTIVRPAGSQLLSWAQRWNSSSPSLGTLSLDSTVVPSIGTGVPLRLMSEVTGTWRVRLLAAVAFWDRELSAPAIGRLEQSAARKWRIASARA